MANITIDDRNYTQYIDHVGEDGIVRVRGLMPRDKQAMPLMMYAPTVIPFPDELLIDDSEVDDRIREQEVSHSSLEHLMNVMGPNGGPIPPKDQDGVGYCWIHSGTAAMECLRALMGLPYVALSAFMAGCLIKGYRDEGGNGIEGPEFFAKNGICSEEYWKAQSMSRSNDTPAMRENAALHKCLKFYGTSDDATLRKRQVISASLRRWPVIADYNWWGHSVLLIRVLSRILSRIRNSWGMWGNAGNGDLKDSKAWPDDAIIPVVEAASEV